MGITETLRSECDPNTGEVGDRNAGQQKDANGTLETVAEVTYRLHQSSESRRETVVCAELG